MKVINCTFLALSFIYGATAQINIDTTLLMHFHYYREDISTFRKIQIMTYLNSRGEMGAYKPCDCSIYENGYLVYNKLGTNILLNDSTQELATYKYDTSQNLTEIDKYCYPLFASSKIGNKSLHSYIKGLNTGKLPYMAIIPERRDNIYYLHTFSDSLKFQDTIKRAGFQSFEDNNINCDTFYNEGQIILSKKIYSEVLSHYKGIEQDKVIERHEMRPDNAILKYIDSIKCYHFNNGEHALYISTYLSNRKVRYLVITFGIEEEILSLGYYNILEQKEQIGESFQYDKKHRLKSQLVINTVNNTSYGYTYIYNDSDFLSELRIGLQTKTSYKEFDYFFQYKLLIR